MEWKVKVGDYVKKGDLVSTIETDKVTVDANAEASGVVVEIHVPEDGTAEVGNPFLTIQLGAEPPAGADAPSQAKAPPQAEAPPAAPPALEAKATTPMPKDPLPAPKDPLPGAKVTPTVAAASKPPTTPDNRGERRVKMTRMRKAIANTLKTAQNTTAMLTTFQEVDMSGLIEMRNQYKDLFEKTHAQRLSFMSPFIKASSSSLQQIPSINAVIDDKTGEVVYRDYIDISVAVSSPRGLVTPVLRNVESMSMQEVEGGMAELAVKARSEQLSMDDLAGGTFTISNGGVFGSMLGTPIINFTPQSAILGMHATKQRPVVLKSGEIVARPVMYLALSYDHRLVDGREAVTFLCSVRDQVEDPRRLLLEI